MAKPDQLRKNRKRRRASQKNDYPAASENKKSRRNIAAAFFVLACVLLLVLGCGSGQHVVKWSGETMGTYYRVTLVADATLPDSQELVLRDSVDAELMRLNQVFSTYIETSEISRWNQLSAGGCLTLSQSLYDVVKIALQVAENSEGYFNPFVGNLVDAWGFGVRQTSTIVPPDEVKTLLLNSRLSAVLFDEDNQELCKSNNVTDVRMDLSAIAKGYAVDQVSALLLEQGFDNVLVDIGGELFARGLNPAGNRWRLAVEKPLQALQQIQQLIQLSDKGVATSGDYRNYYVHDGQRYSHTIDPHTGYPVTHDLASVTVVSSSAALADAWATAVLAAGLERAQHWVRQHDLAIYAIRRDNKAGEEHVVWHSDSFEPYVVTEK